MGQQGRARPSGAWPCGCPSRLRCRPPHALQAGVWGRCGCEADDCDVEPPCFLTPLCRNATLHVPLLLRERELKLRLLL